MSTDEQFLIRALYQGGNVSFTIIPKEGYYSVMIYDQSIAEIQRNEVWEQIRGDILPVEVVEAIGLAIEDYYD